MNLFLQTYMWITCGLLVMFLSAVGLFILTAPIHCRGFIYIYHNNYICAFWMYVIWFYCDASNLNQNIRTFKNLCNGLNPLLKMVHESVLIKVHVCVLDNMCKVALHPWHQPIDHDVGLNFRGETCDVGVSRLSVGGLHLVFIEVEVLLSTRGWRWGGGGVAWAAWPGLLPIHNQWRV